MKISQFIPEFVKFKKNKSKKKRMPIPLKDLAVDAQGVKREKPPTNDPVFQEIIELDVDKLRRVLDSGASLTKLNRDGHTPLQLALHLIQFGGIPKFKYSVAVSIVELLLQRGADANKADRQGKSALYGVVCYWNRFIGHANASKTAEKLAQLLMAHGARVNYQGNKPSLDPFRLALKKHNTKAIQFFIKQGYKLGQWQSRLPGPTVWPPVVGYELFGSLARNNVYDIEATDWCGLSALHRALQMFDGCDQVVGIVHLLDAGANVNALDSAGKSILLKASEKHHLDQKTYSDLLRLVVLRGADVVRDCRVFDWAPLRYALEFGDWDAVRELLFQVLNSNLNLKDLCRYYPLHLAVMNRSVAFLDELLHHKLFDLEQKNEMGDTPLQFALMSTDKPDTKLAQRVELLLQCGARVNSVNRYGWTPLHASCSSALFTCTKLLLKHGADVGVCTSQNEIPLHMAMRCNDSRIPELLISHIALQQNDRECIDLENNILIMMNSKMRNFFMRCQEEISWARSHPLYSWVTFYHLLTQPELLRHVSIKAMLDSLLDDSWRSNYMIYDYLIDDRLSELKFIQIATAHGY